ncbi:hypothetical protein WDU94_012952 [Cyamophila willieti]
MGEAANQKINDAVMKIMVDIDKQFLRKMQADMHRCSVKCCENKDATMEGVQQCLEVCSSPFMRAQKYLQMEFEQYQTRLQRCVLECNDEIKDKMGPNPKQSDMDGYTRQFESCAEKCVDKHISLLPTLFKKIKQYLSDNSSY